MRLDFGVQSMPKWNPASFARVYNLMLLSSIATHKMYE